MKRIILIALVFVSLQSKAQDSITSFWLGRSVGKLPAMVDGLGDDRLGGAKLGYLDTNIVLKVIDSVNNLYQVQLSKYHSAYIEKSYIKRDSSIVEKPFYLTHSWQVLST